MSSVRRVILLGSTGSIGVSTLEVIRHLNRDEQAFEIVGLAVARSADTLLEQAREFQVEHVSVCDESAAEGITDRTVFSGADAARRLVAEVARPGDLLVAAIVGAAGLEAVVEAIRIGCDIALANKETLVSGGELVMPLVKEHGVQLLPVDSEHSAIAQCLRSSRSIEEVRRLVITASGGPFRTWEPDRIRAARVDEALAHPTWTMGRKITIDSASLMNKGLEVIEAHWLFDLPADQIDVIVHPQSIVHSFVEYVDGSVIAQCGPPDMKTPIQYALTSPDRVEGCGPRLDWQQLTKLDFQQLDHDVFPSVRMALEVIRAGGTAGAIYNAANEVAVEAFLDERIDFGDIFELVATGLREIESRPVSCLEDVLEDDARTRRCIREVLRSRSSTSVSTMKG
ncbi:MAG: 1-deoxy-D-xylulose-5-phosphate reductoisomerase [Phycisphaerae bacterium]|nr:1-deoxy-D-xylulose-5-phosphate reductoisomerase [Phycisphaerae bacterium]MDG1899079.1 1-deoxy-D-xylulose-5-phosphate reductoisomerase [Phycisphaerales bacterium]